MLNHILVTLDGSDVAEEAIIPAKQILRPGGRLTLVTAIDVPQHWDFDMYPTVVYEQYQKIADDLLPQAKGYLARMAAMLVTEGFEVDSVVAIGEAATIILETASDRTVDAITMSTHGWTGFKRLLFGSVTSKLLSAAHCPVYVIPSQQKASAPETKVIEHTAA